MNKRRFVNKSYALNEEQIEEMVDLYLHSDMRVCEIADMFGITRATLQNNVFPRIENWQKRKKHSFNRTKSQIEFEEEQRLKDKLVLIETIEYFKSQYNLKNCDVDKILNAGDGWSDKFVKGEIKFKKKQLSECLERLIAAERMIKKKGIGYYVN